MNYFNYLNEFNLRIKNNKIKNNEMNFQRENQKYNVEKKELKRINFMFVSNVLF